MEKTNFENLRIYQQSEQLSDAVWEVVGDWDYFAKKTVGAQLVRAADSIPANIAEGSGRGSVKQKKTLFENCAWLAVGNKELASSRSPVQPARRETGR